MGERHSEPTHVLHPRVLRALTSFALACASSFFWRLCSRFASLPSSVVIVKARPCESDDSVVLSDCVVTATRCESPRQGVHDNDYTRLYVYVYLGVCVCINIYIERERCVYIHTYIHTIEIIYTYIHTHIDTHTHTHTFVQTYI